MSVKKKHRHTDRKLLTKIKKADERERKKKEKLQKKRERSRNDTEDTVKQQPQRFEDRHKLVDCLPEDFTFEKELEAFFNNQESPKILVTTDIKPSLLTTNFSKDLQNLFPNSKFIPRRQGDVLKEIVSEAIERSYTHIILVHESLGKPIKISFIKLPGGPTLQFQLSSLKLVNQICKKYQSTGHFPELILNNMTTRLGKSIGKFFITMFPIAPEFKGREVVTFHNQRDFIFIRRHRYIFNEKGVRGVTTQELGPSFTIKLMALYMTTSEFANVKPIWQWSSHGVTSKQPTI